jgi:hypothetical protein
MLQNSRMLSGSITDLSARGYPIASEYGNACWSAGDVTAFKNGLGPMCPESVEEQDKWRFK